MSIGERIKDLRTQKKLTQSDLAKMVGLLTYRSGGTKRKSNPSSDILQKLAQALDTTSDYLMNGASDEVISAQLTDKELLNQFKAVEKLSQEDKHLIKTFVDAFLTKKQIQKFAH